jgi:hypothetical protein
MLDVRSRNLQVFVGADLQDWSEAVGVFSPARSAVGEDGYLDITADLEILPIPNPPEPIDPYVNPARWHPGTPVLVQVRNDAGSFVDHPQGRLFILEEPEFPEPGAGITLSLGCRIAWHNTFEFDDDQTGVVVGTPENCSAIAQRLLEANEIPSGNISLGVWPYSLAIPQGKGQAGSFLQQAGDLAYSNDFRYLYQNTAGNIVDAALDMGIGSPVVTVTLGINDQAYQPAKVEGVPPEQIKAAGTGTAVTEGENPSIEVAEVIGDLSPFAEGIVTCSGISVISRSVSRVFWSTTGTTLNFRTRTTLYAPRSAVAVKPNIIDFPCDLIDWKITTVHKRFDLANDGRLIDITTTEQQRRFTVTEKVTPRLPFEDTRVTVEVPTYSGREVVDTITVTEHQARAFIDPDSDDPLTLIDSREVETRWRQKSGTTWQKIETERIPRAFTNSTPEGDPAATVGRATTTTSSTGQNQPPRAEFWDGGLIEEDIEYQGTIEYSPAVATGRNRKELYTVPYGFSDGQCETIAALQLRLKAGRHRAATLEFPVSDALLSAPPLFPCDVVFPDGEVRHYRVDSLAWEHDQVSARAIGVGILVGTTAAPTPEVPDPVPVPLTSQAVVSGADAVVDDDVAVYALV